MAQLLVPYTQGGGNDGNMKEEPNIVFDDDVLSPMDMDFSDMGTEMALVDQFLREQQQQQHRHNADALNTIMGPGPMTPMSHGGDPESVGGNNNNIHEEETIQQNMMTDGTSDRRSSATMIQSILKEYESSGGDGGNTNPTRRRPSSTNSVQTFFNQLFQWSDTGRGTATSISSNDNREFMITSRIDPVFVRTDKSKLKCFPSCAIQELGHTPPCDTLPSGAVFANLRLGYSQQPQQRLAVFGKIMEVNEPINRTMLQSTGMPGRMTPGQQMGEFKVSFVGQDFKCHYKFEPGPLGKKNETKAFVFVAIAFDVDNASDEGIVAKSTAFTVVTQKSVYRARKNKELGLPTNTGGGGPTVAAASTLLGQPKRETRGGDDGGRPFKRLVQDTFAQAARWRRGGTRAASHSSTDHEESDDVETGGGEGKKPLSQRPSAGGSDADTASLDESTYPKPSSGSRSSSPTAAAAATTTGFVPQPVPLVQVQHEPIQTAQPVYGHRSTNSSLLLALLLWLPPFGFFGLHHLYMGRKKWGIMTAFTLNLSLIGWVLDGWRLPTLVYDANFNPENFTYSDFGVIWLLFGLFGGHRFTRGERIWGLVYLCTFGGFVMMWLLDGWRLGALYDEMIDGKESTTTMLSSRHHAATTTTTRRAGMKPREEQVVQHTVDDV